MRPFSSAREAVLAVAQAGRKLGLIEDALLRFMTRMCIKIRSGPLKGMKQEVIIPVGRQAFPSHDASLWSCGSA